jgi:biopolymer transport protein ExbB
MGEIHAGRPARWGRPLLGALTVVFALTLIFAYNPPAVYAQEGDPAPAKKDEGGGEQKGAPNLFTHIIVSAGWFFGPVLFLVSIGLVTLIVLLAMDLRMGVAVPGAFVDDFTDMVNKRQFKQAFELCRNDSSYLARVMTAGMGRLQYGIDDAREAAFNMVDSVRAGKENLITYLGTIGTLGPMIGLVGTVYGMILAFMELSIPGATPKPEKLADGISHALVVTLLGVALSVPSIFCYSFFKNRLTRIAMDTANLSDDLLTQMYHNSKKSASAAPTQAAERTSAVQAGQS